jgi:hypothetical protein
MATATDCPQTAHRPPIIGGGGTIIDGPWPNLCDTKSEVEHRHVTFSVTGVFSPQLSDTGQKLCDTKSEIAHCHVTFSVTGAPRNFLTQTLTGGTMINCLDRKQENHYPVHR